MKRIKLYWVLAIILMIFIYLKYDAQIASMTGLSCILLDKSINQNKDEREKK